MHVCTRSRPHKGRLRRGRQPAPLQAAPARTESSNDVQPSPAWRACPTFEQGRRQQQQDPRLRTSVLGRCRASELRLHAQADPDDGATSITAGGSEPLSSQRAAWLPLSSEPVEVGGDSVAP